LTAHHEAHEGHEERRTALEKESYFKNNFFFLRDLRVSLENRKGGESRSVFGTTLDSVIPAWSAGIQPDMDISGRNLHASKKTATLGGE
jgi:hypothetical protein